MPWWAVAALLTVLAACGRPAAVEPLPENERAAVRAYLDAVASINRQAREMRVHLRWWTPGLPGVLWEGRGSMASQVREIEEYLREFSEFETRARRITPVPPAAGDAHAALLRSYEATLRMLDVHRATISAAAAEERAGRPPPPREVWEPPLRAARQDADQATLDAERRLEALTRRLEAARP